jgi:hypothetical protein
MKKRSKAIALFVVCMVIIVGIAFFLSGLLQTPVGSSVNPHYLPYNGSTSKIYLLNVATSYGNSNDTYTDPAGQVFEKGTPIFVITLTLRNDYTSDNPAPPLPNQVQTSPADGTAYLYLTTNLFNKSGQLNATTVSPTDFSLPAIPGTGLVLASGQTKSISVYLATSQTNINKYEVNLYFLGDSIPP